MEKALLNKIKSYSSLAGVAAIAATTAKADIIYNNIDPDKVLSQTSDLFEININNDGTYEFRLRGNNTNNSFPAFGSFMGYSGNYYKYWSVLDLDDDISNGQNFLSQAFVSYSTSSDMYLGPSANFEDKYIGVRFTVSGVTHYGWVRINAAPQWANITVKDFAYKDVNHAPIKAGNVDPIDRVSAPTAINNPQNYNPSDITVSFNKLDNEANVMEYRLMCVRSSSAGDFTLADAESTPDSNCVKVVPNGNNHSIILPSTFRARSGNLMEPKLKYRFFVLAVSKYPDKNILVGAENTLSNSSLDISYDENTTSVPEFEGDNTVKISNSNGVIFINSADIIEEITIVNLSGQPIKNISKVNTNSISVEASELSKGLYIILINTSAKLVSKKIIL